MFMFLTIFSFNFQFEFFFFFFFLCRQLSLDCGFLESQQIIDYSLLLGLHFRAPEHLRSLLEPPDSLEADNTNTAADGGYLF